MPTPPRQQRAGRNRRTPLRGGEGQPQDVTLVLSSWLDAVTIFSVTAPQTGLTLKGFPAFYCPDIDAYSLGGSYDGNNLEASWPAIMQPGYEIVLAQYDPALRTRWGGYVSPLSVILPEQPGPPPTFQGQWYVLGVGQLRWAPAVYVESTAASQGLKARTAPSGYLSTSWSYDGVMVIFAFTEEISAETAAQLDPAFGFIARENGQFADSAFFNI